MEEWISAKDYFLYGCGLSTCRATVFEFVCVAETCIIIIIIIIIKNA